jgi:hypothetical protein
MKYINLLLFIVFSPLASLSPVYILVHGTWTAQDIGWHTAETPFYTTLKQHNPEARVISFAWSGNNTHQARIDAGKNLANLIESYPEGTPIILIAHSHGGNVCFLASRELAQRNSAIQLTVVCLGTPINREFYGPSMRCIQRIFNLFSLSDFVQPVFGMFGRLLSTERTINAAIVLNGKEPDHYQLHDPLIAQWLPHLLENRILDTTFWYGVIHFQLTEPPILQEDSSLVVQVAENQQLIYNYLSAVEQQLLFRSMLCRYPKPLAL